MNSAINYLNTLPAREIFTPADVEHTLRATVPHVLCQNGGRVLASDLLPVRLVHEPVPASKLNAHFIQDPRGLGEVVETDLTLGRVGDVLNIIWVGFELKLRRDAVMEKTLFLLLEIDGVDLGLVLVWGLFETSKH